MRLLAAEITNRILFMATIAGFAVAADGSVVIPEALRPYLGGLEKIEPKG